MRRLFLIFLVFLFLLTPRISAEEEFRTDYTVDYFVTAQDGQINTRVTFSTKITNLQKDVYVDQYQLAFPASFRISNITASDDSGSVTPEVQADEKNTSIKMKLNDPRIGQNTSNTLSLTFNQENLFKINGNVWEVILPTITGRELGSYSVRVHLPPTDKKIAIAKPAPTRIEGNVIHWDNPSVKTIYAVFGDRQFYSLDLSYHLANEKLVPVYTEIALPPDTLYQQIFVDAVKPAPTSVRIDEDGNYLARYDLKPKEQKDVRFTGYAQVFTEPRDAMRKITRVRFEKQKPYLLQESEFWSISDKASYKHLTTPEAVYKSVVGSFSYDYDRLTNRTSYRLGAETALKNPTKAVCVEFTDTFIALSRANGIYAREIQGFGFSQDERLRPLSLISDVLHSWPEYYDSETGIWKQIDPTWENTSGIDYFSSFDLDHIAFAIHGRDPEDPPPAGTYKLEDSRDVNIKVAAALPAAEISLSATKLDVARSVSDKQSYTGSVEIVNNGNVTAYEVPVAIESQGFTISPSTSTIDSLPPYGSKKISFTYRQKAGLASNEGSITVKADDQATLTRSIRITPMIHTVTVVISAIVAVTFIILLLFLHKHHKKR